MLNNKDFELPKIIIIMVSGKAGVGKTTTAKFMQKYYIDQHYSCSIIPFAEELKSIAYHMGWDGKKDTRGRILLQKLGLIGREYDQNCWTKLVDNNIKHDESECMIYIMDDWRFPNEFDYFHNNPNYIVFTIRVQSPDRELLKGTPEYFDESETALPEPTGFEEVPIYHYELLNSFDLDYLNSQSKFLANTILSRIPRWGVD